MPRGSLDLFLLGLASGVTLLTITGYRRVSPPWLRWLLIASGLLLMSRYVTMALVITSPHQELVRFVGLTLPAGFAVDQLIRHPAMTPQKLLRWYVPIAIVGGVALMWHSMALVLVEMVFFIGFVGVCLILIRKIPVPPVRRALSVLALAYGCLGLDSVIRLGIPYHEMAALLALWYAYETSARLQQSI